MIISCFIEEVLIAKKPSNSTKGKNILTPEDAHFLVCGSLPFVRDVWQKLSAAGVSELKISTETFFEQ
jgi:ferredoxin-NADP reductase